MQILAKEGTPFGQTVRIVLLDKADQISRSVPLEKQPHQLRGIWEVLGCQQIVSMQQQHGARVQLVKAPASKFSRQSATDGLLTSVPGIALAVATADCFGIFFYNESARTLGVLHVGWKAIASGLLRAARKKALALKGWDDAKTWVFVGPGIGPCHYRANRSQDAPKIAALRATDPTSVRDQGGEIVLDLPRAIAAELRSWGIPPGQIIWDGRCSVEHNQKLPSHWQEGSAREFNLLGVGCLPSS